MPRPLLAVLAVLLLASGGCASLARFLAERTPGVRMSGDEALRDTQPKVLDPSDQAAGELDRSETLANVDRILEEHPEAANRGRLERLRRDMGAQRGEGEPVRSDTTLGDRGELSQGKAVVAGPRPPPSRHDRRVEDWSDRHRQSNPTMYDQIREAMPARGLDNKLTLGGDRREPPAFGYHDSGRLPVVPPATEFGRAHRPTAVHRLSGLGDKPTSTDPSAVPIAP